ncbi:hypothetical protein RM697_11795 [Ichthyenterobacterium sp. W332]|uniref:TonB-dependent receptor plug domain-containing protein n=1 Tax=Microcosmobacter mediterraneus TaxID=3075607 RepID=A0ABU2YME6_9FLAO|nr:hypothetical protein [Ichthyenterobacterium sp. W332]MDT0559338.1 hypothetical protein [Ichthyenterobacterium sp. W332]
MKNRCLILLLLCSISLYSQDDELVLDAFDDFTELTREQVYIHLNKTVFIKGEMLAFNAYSFIKESQELSFSTTNLYCQIINDKNQVVKEKLILVNQGVSRGDFIIDSLFTTGEYKFKAYTNWMKNFPDEHNYFLESFRVLDPENLLIDKPTISSGNIDLQVLPEGGHLLQDTDNIIGVIAKDQLGLGVAGLKLLLIDDLESELTEFKLNAFGIGKFVLNPKPGRSYFIRYTYNESQFKIPINNIDPRGVVLSLKDLKDDVVISLKTNNTTLPKVANKSFRIYIHNGVELKDVSISFNGETQSTLKIRKSNLFTGINIFTLFNDDNTPLVERMFFNYRGINNALIKDARPVVKGDSLEVKIPVIKVDESQFQNISISVLPKDTKSYYHHENIVSTIYLKPFIKTPVQNASYYFTDITLKKQLELDNVLLTQGWSSYNWNRIFNKPPDYNYDFEVGISYTINSNDNASKGLLIYPNINSKSEVINFTENQRTLERKGLFPLDDEKLRIGEFRKGIKVGKSKAVLQFYPNTISQFSTDYIPVSVTNTNQLANTEKEFFKYKDIEELNEVKVVAKKGFTRLEKLQNATLGRITEFDEKERKLYRTLGQFLSGRGFMVEETPDEDPIDGSLSFFRIYTRNKASINATDVPIIFLDGVRLVDLDILQGFSMEFVDYVEVNKGGVGEGIRGGAGVIRVYTDPQKRFKVKPRESFSVYNIPLTFTTPKRFYTPKYSTFSSDFFKEYGVIDWFPNVRVGKDGTITLKILNTKQPIKLCIEGVVNSALLISDIVTVED